MLDSAWVDYDSADILRRLLRLYGYSVSDMVELSATLGPQFALGRNFISNAKRRGVMPRQTHLYGLAKALNLTIGGAYRIFNVELDKLREMEGHLNFSRTRLIESYAFYRDRKVNAPLAFVPAVSLDRSAYLSDWIASWQQVPIRALDNPLWRPQEFLYAQIGAGDDTAYPAIPRGATVQAVLVDPREARHPDPDRHYLVQHGRGYLCTRCSTERGLLHVLSSGGFYPGPRHLALNVESRIFARAVAFFSPLPLLPVQSTGVEIHGPPAAIVLPWEHSSQQRLVAIERSRFGRTMREFDEIGAQARALLGFGVSARFAEEIEDSPHPPNTHSILALSLMCSLRFQDVLRSGGMPIDDTNRFSLSILLNAHKPDDLPKHAVEIFAPRPAETWSALQSIWRRYAALLSTCSPGLADTPSQWLYLRQSEHFQGMDALIPPGSILLLRHLSTQQASQPVPEDNRRDWERPIYLVRVANRLLCSYLYADRNFLTLVPHPASSDASPYTIERAKAQIVALVTGIFSTLP